MSSDNNGTSGPPATLSRGARAVYWFGPPATILIVLAVSPKTAALIPAVALPTIYAIREHRALPTKQKSDFETCLWSYVFSATVGITAAALGQLVLVYGFLYPFHGRNTAAFLEDMVIASPDSVSPAVVAAHAAVAWSWRNVVQRAWMTYVVAGIWEEGIKYFPVAYARRHSLNAEDQAQGRASLHYAIASGLGFGTMENILGIFGSVQAGDSTLKVVLTFIERFVIGTLSHVLLISLVDLRLSRRVFESHEAGKQGTQPAKRKALPLSRVFAPSMLYHGTSNFAMFSISAMNGNLGWVHPTDAKSLTALASAVGGLIGLLVLHVRQEWKSLKERERKNI